MAGINDEGFMREEFALGAGHLSYDFDPLKPWEYTKIAVSRGGGTLIVAPTIEKIAVDNVSENSKKTWFMKDYVATLSLTALNVNAESIKLAMPFADLIINEDNGFKRIVPRAIIKDTDFRHMWYITLLGDGNTLGCHLLRNACSINGLNIKFNSYRSEQAENSLEFNACYDPDDLSIVPYEYLEFTLPPEEEESLPPELYMEAS
jgi:hypothetical protein